jgi:hypothetical protein
MKDIPERTMQTILPSVLAATACKLQVTAAREGLEEEEEEDLMVPAGVLDITEEEVVVQATMVVGAVVLIIIPASVRLRVQLQLTLGLVLQQ